MPLSVLSTANLSHAAFLVDLNSYENLYKISNTIYAKKSNDAEQCATDENSFSRIRKKFKELNESDGSGLYREEDLGSREGVNPDQSRNSVELPDPSDHSQESDHQSDFERMRQKDDKMHKDDFIEKFEKMIEKMEKDEKKLINLEEEGGVTNVQ
ncbi:MAG TPA: hypothetical protein VHV10_07780, partial [Ktedonobacteraceae bacterium]|nr:hypothetical protein [Ktedonobacteraceae bacterium]